LRSGVEGPLQLDPLTSEPFRRSQRIHIRTSLPLAGSNHADMNYLSRVAQIALLLSALCIASTAAAPGDVSAPATLSQEQIRELIRRTADNDILNDKKQRDYTYVERQEMHKLNGKGQVKSTEIETSNVINIYGEQVQKLVAKNDQPLSDKDAKREDEKIQKLIDKRKNESDSERKKRLAKEEKDREDQRLFVREVADAYNFKFIGVEQLNGRDNYVIDGDPKPGYKPIRKEAGILPKMRFRVWIDKDDTQMKKIDVQIIDTISFGLFLARLHKGSRVIVENTRVNNEVWLQQHVAVKVDARLALLKDFNIEVDVSDRDYKKFRTDTKIVPIAEGK